MEIAFIYPQMDTEYFAGSIDSFNGDISIDNLKSLLPRGVVFVSNIILYILWAVFEYRLFIHLTRFVTAKDIGIIELALVLYVFGFVVSLKLLSVIKKLLRPYLLKALRGREAIESYSFSQYVERNDKEKLARDRARYLAQCDILKNSKILDASVVCDGSVCKLETKFENGGRVSIYTFLLDYKESPDVDRIIVDFDRKTVLFPEEDYKNDEEKTSST